MIDWLFNLWDNRELGGIRSPKWSAVQKSFIAIHPTCAFCGKRGELLNPLNVHHQVPFSQNPALELLDSNLLTLCRRHHLDMGHLGSWKSWNDTVKEDCAVWLAKRNNRP